MKTCLSSACFSAKFTSELFVVVAKLINVRFGLTTKPVARPEAGRLDIEAIDKSRKRRGYVHVL